MEQTISIAVSLILATVVHSMALRLSAILLRMRALFTLKRCVAYAAFSALLLSLLRPLLEGVESAVATPLLLIGSVGLQALTASAFYALLLGGRQMHASIRIAGKAAIFSVAALLLIAIVAAVALLIVNASIDDPAAAAAAIHAATSAASSASAP